MKSIKDINGEEIKVNHILLDKNNDEWVAYISRDGFWSYKPLHEIPGEGAYFLTPNEVNNAQLKIIGEIFKLKK